MTFKKCPRYNALAILLPSGMLYKSGIPLLPAMGVVFMAGNTVILAVNVRFLEIR